MTSDDPAATAEGDFQKTPLPHLLVYMADRRLTGALFLKEPQGTEHVVRFEWGAPVRVQPGDGFALFGEMLVEAGVVGAEVVRGALATQGLLGDVLLLTGHAAPDDLETVASEQLLRRMVRLFALPAETTYRYFDQHHALAGAAPPCRVDVLRLLLEGLRAHPRSGLSLSRLLELLGDTPLHMHPDALVDRFGFDANESPVIEAISATRPTFVDLLSSCPAESSIVRRVVYTLLLARQLDLGQKTTPLGHGEGPPVPVGRVNLASAVHRLGAAAPDPAGDGERAAVMPRRLRRRKSRPEPLPNVPIVGCDPDDEPISDVIEIDPPPGPPGLISGEHAIGGKRANASSGEGGPSAAIAASAGLPPTSSGMRPCLPDDDADEEPVSDVVEINGPADAGRASPFPPAAPGPPIRRIS